MLSEQQQEPSAHLRGHNDGINFSEETMDDAQRDLLSHPTIWWNGQDFLYAYHHPSQRCSLHRVGLPLGPVVQLTALTPNLRAVLEIGREALDRAEEEEAPAAFLDHVARLAAVKTAADAYTAEFARTGRSPVREYNAMLAALGHCQDGSETEAVLSGDDVPARLAAIADALDEHAPHLGAGGELRALVAALCLVSPDVRTALAAALARPS